MKGFTMFVLGALAGSIAAALATPVTGAELRARIRSKLQSLGVGGDEEIDELVELIATDAKASQKK